MTAVVKCQCHHLVYFLPVSAIPSPSPGSFPWRMVLETKIWEPSVLIGIVLSLSLGLLNRQSRRHTCYMIPHTHIYLNFLICKYMHLH